MTNTKTAIKLLKCVGPLWYVSSPISTGVRKHRFEERYSYITNKSLYDSLYKKYVIEPNCADARLLAESYRSDLLTVLCPADFYEPSWSQEDYLAFWEEVITESVHTVVFNHGWEYSHGCNEEFVLAHKLGIRCLDDNDNEALSVEDGYNMAKHASQHEPWWPEVEKKYKELMKNADA